MIRNFHTHHVRPTLSLDGRWEFVTAAERKDRAKLPNAYRRRVHVPSAWETLPGLESYRGQAWLRREIPRPAEGLALRLVFGGVSHTGTVFVNGREMGDHYDAFTPWDVVVPPQPGRGPLELVVRVDNTFGEHSALHIPNDYMTYGGITRPVQWEAVPPAYLDKLFVTPERAGKGWRLALRVRVANWSDQTIRRSVRVTLGEAAIDLGSVSVPAGGRREISGALDVPNVQPWSPDSPTLYEVAAHLYDGEEIVDDLIERTGFRTVKVEGDRILFNGQPIRLRGYNRHEDHPQFGCALPLEAMIADLELLRDLGANFIRTSHYPNDQRFLDLCDELGFYVWEESHARAVNFKHPRFREQIAASTTEMIEWHHNHPSIILWGCLNECETRTRAGYREHERVLGLMKKLDPSRPVTYAACYREKDLCLGLADVVSWNLYTGWYGGTPDQTRAVLDDLLAWLHSPRSHGGAGKPVIVSEFGAGGIYGYRHPRHCHWSEEYQSQVLEENLSVYLHHPAVCGAAIWQYCDIRLTPEWWYSRPRNMNNKGTVDEYRRPKLCYDTVKRLLHQAREQWDTREPAASQSPGA